MNKSINNIDLLQNKFEIIPSNNNEPFILTEALFVGDKEKIEDFICSICLDMINNPKQCKECNNLFCESCIDEYNIINNLCPICKEPFIKQNINKYVRKNFEKFEFLCSRNCSKIIKYFDSDKHIQICSKNETNYKCNLCLKKLESKKES